MKCPKCNKIMEYWYSELGILCSYPPQKIAIYACHKCKIKTKMYERIGEREDLSVPGISYKEI